MTEHAIIVSVIITTYNRSCFIRRAINSVLSQTYTDFELIVVNDASTDGTEEIIAGFSDKRMRYICHKENKGGPAARNVGICRAKGKYIAFLDDDDEWLPMKLEKEARKIEECSDEVGLIYSGAEIKEEGRTVSVFHPKFERDIQEQLLFGPMIGSVSYVLVKKECFERLGLFDETFQSCQDWDMWKRIAELYEFDFVPDVLTRIHLHDFQISTNIDSLIQGKTRIIEKYREELMEHPEILLIHLKNIGKLYSIKGDWKRAIYYFRKAVKISFFQIVKILAWCIIELPGAKKFSRYKIDKKL